MAGISRPTALAEFAGALDKRCGSRKSDNRSGMSDADAKIVRTPHAEAYRRGLPRRASQL